LGSGSARTPRWANLAITVGPHAIDDINHLTAASYDDSV
jgi:hypothetical protein